MAHFAELKEMTDPTGFTSDTHLVVQRVVVVGNDVPANGETLEDNDMHVDGETWCIKFFKGGVWKQTSYNNNFRKKYAGGGDIYDPVKDKFILAQPYLSWSLDDNDDWKAPISFPTIRSGENPEAYTYMIEWNDAKYQEDNTKGWEAIRSNDISETPAVYDWNGTAWIAS
tara:strand:- start:343 stop:852 length:510 start_codon:yes stop_codon:yes gene_type:complete